MKESYSIHLPQFEGPFDLLLFFIERDELNIYDIPISDIANNFWDYIQQMELLDIEVASEFILVASTLMRIKAKMLLPRRELNEQGEEIDPREELVERLIEYKKFKDVSVTLTHLEDAQLYRRKRGNIQSEINTITEQYTSEIQLHDLNLYSLLKIFQKTMKKMERRENKIEHQIIKYPHTIREEKDQMLRSFSTKKDVSFEKLFEQCATEIHAIFRFLAVLELIQLNMLSLHIGRGINNFWVRKIDHDGEQATKYI